MASEALSLVDRTRELRIGHGSTYRASTLIGFFALALMEELKLSER